jgi:hypothetical protein
MFEQPEMELAIGRMRQIIASSDMKQIAAQCEVNYTTVTRWAQPDGSLPGSPQTILKLAKMNIPELEDVLRIVFPRIFKLPEEPEVIEIPSSWIAELLAIRSNNAEYTFPYTFHNRVYEDMALQLDPVKEGFLSLFVGCMPPDSTGFVTQLRVHHGSGTNENLWGLRQIDEEFLVGAQSLCGAAIQLAGPAFYRQHPAPEIADHFFYPDSIGSAGVFPLTLWGQKIAGMLFVASVNPDFFSQSKRNVLRVYANILALGLKESQFYPSDRIRLI